MTVYQERVIASLEKAIANLQRTKASYDRSDVRKRIDRHISLIEVLIEQIRDMKLK